MSKLQIAFEAVYLLILLYLFKKYYVCRYFILKYLNTVILAATSSNILQRNKLVLVKCLSYCKYQYDTRILPETSYVCSVR